MATGAIGQQIRLSTIGTVGAAYPGAKLYTYLSGTSTPYPVYHDASLNTSYGAYVQADSTGVFPTFYTAAVNYRVLMTDSAGATILPAQDNYFDFAQTQLSASGGSALVGFLNSGAGAVADTVQDELRALPKNVQGYGAMGDGTTDDTAAVQNAINAAYGSVVYFPPGTYKITSTLTVTQELTMIGAHMRSTILKWDGGASPMIDTGTSAQVDNFEIREMSWNNTGSATVALQLDTTRAVVSRIFTNPTVAFSTAIIKTRGDDNVYQVVFRDCAFYSDTGQANPIGVHVVRGHSISFDNTMFSGHVVGVKLGDSGVSGGVVTGASFTNGCRFEAFANPGGASAIGIDVDQVNTLAVEGASFEFADSSAGMAGQLSIRLVSIKGGSITGCYFDGTGQQTTSIKSTGGSNVGPVFIDGNVFSRVNGYGVTQDAGAKLVIGTNSVPDPTTGVLALSNSQYALTYSASVTPNPLVGDPSGITALSLTVTDTNAFLINNPDLGGSRALGAPIGQAMSLTIINSSGGTMGTVTWDSRYLLAPWSPPANGQSTTVVLRWNGASWVEIARTPSAVPNSGAVVAQSGTFTPGVSFGGGSTGVTYAQQAGYWVRDGDYVRVLGTVRLSAKGSSTGSFRVTGLPFGSVNVSGTSAVIPIGFSTLTGVSGAIWAFVQPGGTAMRCWYQGTGAETDFTDTNINNATEIYFNGSYKIA